MHYDVMMESFCEYYKFYAVHVYLRTIPISLLLSVRISNGYLVTTCQDGQKPRLFVRITDIFSPIFKRHLTEKLVEKDLMFLLVQRYLYVYQHSKSGQKVWISDSIRKSNYLSSQQVWSI